MTIVRYEPWALVNRFQRQLERALGEDSADSASVSWIPHVDIHEEAERFLVVADVPGRLQRQHAVEVHLRILVVVHQQQQHALARRTANYVTSQPG